MTTLAIVVVLAELAAAAVIAALGLWRFCDVHGRWPFTSPQPPAPPRRSVPLADPLPLPGPHLRALPAPEGH